MKIDVSLHGDVAKVRIEGRIVDGEAANDLKAALRGVLRGGRNCTIIDVSEVKWFDSLAIGILAAHYISSTRTGGKVLLMGASEKIRRMMEMVRIDDRFGWASNLDEAMKWFQMESS
jgi:anti-anti-sigma factor